MARLLHSPVRSAVVLVTAFALAACGGTSSSGSRSEQEGGDDAGGTVEFVTFPSITRLTPTVDVDDPEAGDAIALEAARGEREGGQLVAWASDGTPRVVLDATALRGTGGARIPAKRVRAYVEHAMVAERGSPAGRAGTYVDPLIPAAGRDVVLTADERLLAWIDVEVPTDAVPGRYTGSVLLRRAGKDGAPVEGDEQVLARIPVTVHVRRATLPHVPTLGSHVGHDGSQMVRFEEVEAGSPALREVTDRYAAELAAARLSIGDVGVLPPGALDAGAPGDDAYLRRIFDRRGVATVRIPFYMDHPFADPLGADRPAAVRYLRRAAAWARANGWGDRMNVFAIDEPGPERAGEVRELHELVHEADRRLPLLVTHEPDRAFAGSVDIWAPNISKSRFRPAEVARAQRGGTPSWWYPSITTWQPYPTLFIDDLRPSPRALGWLAWRHDIKGFLYWSSTHWHEVEDPYRDPATYRETDAVGNGDGVLLYPGGPIGLPGTPIPSVRLFQLRDGIEDHDLLELADCAGGGPVRGRLARATAAAAPAMDRVDPAAAQVDALRALALGAIERAGDPSRCRTTRP